jgi:hypothetical protein
MTDKLPIDMTLLERLRDLEYVRLHYDQVADDAAARIEELEAECDRLALLKEKA